MKRKAPARAAGSSSSGIDFAAVRELARLAADFDLAEVEADRTGRVRVRRTVEAVATAAPSRAAPPTIALAPQPLAAVPAPAEPGTFVTSPFVGTFYRAPSPDAAAFVESGQTVRKGQVLCIVEAMKLMNEIEAETDGKIAEILAKNGDHVEYGQNLFRLVRS